MSHSDLSRPDTLPVRIPLPAPIKQRFIGLHLMTVRLWFVLYRTSSFSDLLEEEYVPPPELVHLPRWLTDFRDRTGLLPALLTLPFMLLLIAISTVFGAMVAGAMIATQTASRLTIEHITRRHELLSVTPRGALGANFGLAVGVMHDNRRFVEVQFLFYIFCGALAMLTVLLALPVGNVDYEPGAPLLIFDHFGDGVALALFTLTLYVEYRQSLITGALIGMLAPSLVSGDADSRVIIPALFIGIHSVVYALLGMLIFILYAVFGVHSTLILSLLFCAGLFACREWILRRVWLEACRRFNTDDRALDQLLEEYER